MNFKDRVKKLVRRKASSIQPHPANWRRHPESQRDVLSDLLEEIGFAGVVLTRELPSGKLQAIDGHLRRDLAGDADVPCIVTDLSAGEAKKLLATFDTVGAMAETDVAAFESLRDSLSWDSPALSTFLGELDFALPDAPSARESPTGTAPDDIPESDGPVISRAGDTWLLGVHRLHCGDATAAKAVELACGKLTPSLMVTDPPYGVDYDPAWRNRAAERGTIGFGERAIGTVKNDGQASWLAAWQLFPGDVAYVWHDGLIPAVLADLIAAGFEPRSQIIWRKARFAISRGHYHWQHESCAYAVREGKAASWCGDRSQTTVWDVELETASGGLDERTNHGTQKPVECMARPMRHHGKAGDVVYDPFAGSGACFIAAERESRRCVGVDIDPVYCDLAVERWQAYTGQEATLAETGQTHAQSAKSRRKPAKGRKRASKRRARGKA